jgi:hypothetical protein
MRNSGILVVNARGVSIEGFEFYGAKSLDGSQPAAGIRVEDGYGITVRNCAFHDNEVGLSAGDSAEEIRIESSEFFNNSADNITIGHAARFVLSFSYAHHGRSGSLVSSRAAENQILYNRLTEESGAGLYELVFPNGGLTYVIGNVIQQGLAAGHSSILGYLTEGLHAANPSLDLFVMNNTFVQEVPEGAVFVYVGADNPTPAVLRNNIFFGPGEITNQSSAVKATNLTIDPKFVNPSEFDYRLQATSPAINSGTDPGSFGGLSLAPLYSFAELNCAETRQIQGVIDIGAYEYGSSSRTCEAQPDFSSRRLLSNVSSEPVTSGENAAAATSQAGNPLAALIPADITIAIGSGTGTPGSSVSVPVNLSGTTQPGGLQWTLTYPANVVSSVQFTIGAAGSAAGKTLTCSTAAGGAMCVLYGINTTTIGNGVIANATFQLSSSAPQGAATISVINPVATTTGADGATVTTSNGSLTVQAAAGVAVSVSPTSATLSNSQTRQFSATVTGTTNTAVTWSISPSVGTISTSGLYTAPASVTTSQTVTVRATSVADTTKSATATVSLVPPVSVTVSPTSATLTNAQTRQFSATVTGSTNTSVTWSISPSVGTISTSGLYTAPASVTTAQSVTVRATSVADTTKSATATVSLVLPVGVTVSPTSATLTNSQTRQFSATVTGSTNTSVTWSISPSVGTISTSGLYTAPASITTAQAVTVRATSVADTTKSATATVNLTPPVVTIGVAVNPTSSTLGASQTQQFGATVTGTTNTAVTWSVSPSVGTISTAGLYTAPSSITSAQTVSVRATSVADTTKFATATVNLTTASSASAIRVNSGGGAYTDPQGRLWSADYGSTTGSTYVSSNPISGTDAPALYQSERWHSSQLIYEYTVPNGTYQVTLKFAEIYFTSAGQRVFHVDINGQRQLTNFDPCVAGGGPNRAADRTFTVSVTNSKVTIQLVPVVSNPEIGALEILPQQQQPPAFTPIRVNAGGGAYTDSQGRVWSADTGYDSGSTYVTTLAVSGADAPAVYQSERWHSATFKYEFAVPNGSYQVNLKFAEIYFTSPGQRVFHVDINGQRQLTNFDPVAAAGGANKAVDRSFTVSVTNSKVTVQFVPVTSYPKISGIEIQLPGTFTPIRVNAGGPAYTDLLGRQWAADTGYDLGSAYGSGAAVSAPDAPDVYRSERWHSSTFKYEFAVPNGTYQVNLKFAEIYFTSAGQRVFHVDINGQRQLTNFDPFTAAGGANRPVDRSFTVTVTNSKATIQFVPVTSNPKISGIEIF